MGILVVAVTSTGDRVNEAAVLELDSGLLEQRRDLFDVRAGFCESAETIADRLDGRVMAAYNLPFVQGVLANEYQRCGYTIDKGQGVDIQFENISLEDACEKEGITRPTGGAMAKADAAAALMRRQAAKGLLSSLATIPGWLSRG